MTPDEDRLEAYRRKRAASATPEPFGGEGRSGTGEAGGPTDRDQLGADGRYKPRLFVVQMHAARNLHWDLRLERNGALESWAVPKGPSPDQADKRLAMHVEPHPLEYADFEGVIPEGQYGAGPSICWDRGVWIEIPAKPGEKPHGLEHGKLLFELRGYKLRGLWTLVHTPKPGDNHWLLIKERDQYLDEGGTDVYPHDSIFSGLTVDELADPGSKRTRIVSMAKELGARKKAPAAADVKVMKATALDEPFSREGWVFEIKYDGYRLIADRNPAGATLWSRNGNDLTETFPEIGRAIRGLPFDGTILDGEVVVHDESGMPNFSRLQRRGRLQRRTDIAVASVQLPATYYAFDLLAFGGLDLRPLPLLDRKKLLKAVLPSIGPIRFSDHIPEQGEAVFDHAVKLQIEGIVGKKADARYRSGRSDDWVKIRTIRTDDFVVVGWTEPKGSRSGFGALHLAQWSMESPASADQLPDGGAPPGGSAMDSPADSTSPSSISPTAPAPHQPRLRYVGSVGTGFSDALIDELSASLLSLEIADSPCDEGELPSPKGRGPKTHHWTRPELVVEVHYKEFTDAGMLRHPSFQRVRDDKPPQECVWSGNGELPEPSAVTGGVEKHVALTNLDKVLFPPFDPAEAAEAAARNGEVSRTGNAPAHSGVTKGEVIGWYEAAAEWMLPYTRGRCLVLTRYPDGIHGNSFYQKNAPEWAPEWIRTATVYSEGSERDLDYFVVDDVETLRYVANSAGLLMHVWSSRVETLAHPDWCILDLDPKSAPFSHVVEVALLLREICEDIGLPVHVKTSGSSGLHLIVPLGRQVTHDQSKQIGQLLATVAVQERGDIATIDRVIERRDGKVYVDFLQNGWGKLLVAPYSTRPVPEASVSMPLHWDEVGADLGPRDFTIPIALDRLASWKADPLVSVLEQKPNLLAALERLMARVQG